MKQKPAHDALGEYIRAQGMKKKDFAKAVGVRNDHLSRWLSGKVQPGASARILIAQITGGVVPAEGWK